MMSATKQVRFTSHVEVTVFDRIIDPVLKANLYYTEAEMNSIRKRFHMAIALQRQFTKCKELQERFKDIHAYIDYVKRMSEAQGARKRLLTNNSHSISSGTPVLAAKRQRIQ